MSLVLILWNLGCRHSHQPAIEARPATPVMDFQHSVYFAHQTVDHLMQQQNPNFAQCHQSQLNRRRQINGRLVVRFVIDENGAVQGLEAKEDTLNNPRLTACVFEVIEGISFPAGLKSDVVRPLEPLEDRGEASGYEVVYPFVFRTS